MTTVFGPPSRQPASTYPGADSADKACSPISLISLSSIVGQVTYIAQPLATLMGAGGAIQRIQHFSRERVSNRLQNGANRKDLFYYLVSANNSRIPFTNEHQHQSGEEGLESEHLSVDDLMQEGILAIIAGSDTVQSTLSCALYYLVCNPAVYMRLQEEVDDAFASGEEPLDMTKLSSMEWLNACM